MKTLYGFLAAIVMVAMTTPGAALAQGQKNPPPPVCPAGHTCDITAKAINSHDTNPNEWGIVITGTSGNAPANVNVCWSDGNCNPVNLTDVTGPVAHYVTTMHLTDGIVITGITTSIQGEWNGEFNLSHGPAAGGCTGDNCGGTVTATPPTPTPPTPTQPTSTQIVCDAGTHPNPEGTGCDPDTTPTLPPTDTTTPGTPTVIVTIPIGTLPHGTPTIEPPTQIVPQPTACPDGTRTDSDGVCVGPKVNWDLCNSVTDQPCVNHWRKFAGEVSGQIVALKYEAALALDPMFGYAQAGRDLVAAAN